MTKAEATAEVFITAFKALPRKEREAVIMRMIEDERLRQDLFDIALAEQRMNEPTRPLKDVMSEIKLSKRSQ